MTDEGVIMSRFKGLCGLSGVVMLGALGACGGGGSSSTPPPVPPPVTYTIGGTVSGLVGSVVLQNNAGNNLTVSAAGAFTFSAMLSSGAAYAVTVLTQPATQTCTITNGSGAANANVTTVQVACTTNPLTLSSSTPTNNATGVDRAVAPAMVFSAALDATTVTTGNVTLSSAAGNQAIAVNASGTQLTATPSRQLLPVTTYTLRAATDVRGGAGGQLAAAVTTSFTTRDAQWRAPTLIETDDAGDTYTPQIAFDAAGNALSVWSQSDGTRTNIWANRHVAGTGWGTATLVEMDNTDGAERPQVAFDAAGNAIVVWYQFDGTRNDIWANRYTAGAGWGTAARIETSADDAGAVQVAMDTNGNALAVWTQSSSGSGWSIWANRYTAASGWGTAALVETDTGGAFVPQVAMDANGNALAVWRQYDGTRYSIRASRYSVGSGWSSAGPIESGTGEATAPQIAVDASGNALAVWYQSDGTRNNIWANRYVVGIGWGTAALIETDNAGDAFLPQIAVDASGNAHAVWYQDDGVRTNIWANRYVVGTGWGTATLIETDDAGDAFLPQIAVDASGNALAVWYQSDGARTNIWVNRYVMGSGWGAATLIETDNAGTATSPQIAVDASGNALVVWSQSSGSRYSIHSARFD
jgi:hypothetical protein